jgi:hypothetical protein
MKLKYLLSLVIVGLTLNQAAAEDITTLDGQTYTEVRDVALKPGGLFFVTGTDSNIRGVTVPYADLPDDVKERHHYDPYELALAYARQNQPVNLTKGLAFSLDNLEAAKKKAKDEKKLLGFIMVWDDFFYPFPPDEPGQQQRAGGFL